MALRNHTIDNKILTAAKLEFINKGFKNASLRKIAELAGVTTGAIYIRYKNKDDLFCTLAQEATQVIERNIMSLKKDFYDAGRRHSIEDLIVVSSSEINAILDMIYQHYDACYLLFCCAKGSSMENFMEKLVSLKVDSTIQFFRDIMGKDVAIERESLMLIIESEYNTYTLILRNRYDKLEAQKYIETVIRYFVGGWRSIFNNIIKED
ncbi:TetR family transcriptional regulator [Vallitalea longa]|uniref:TetR family transcriptional regulator n=1 Tax=Vallitalea longa TaxID=2936439 RepID=A0A9W6DG48_9FIRM|nr:TetR/AcrR family transcriptional regulator [Vallitalea longa]GKX31245.1 TetR family transcriptional regulator [Vallitalea longa]